MGTAIVKRTWRKLLQPRVALPVLLAAALFMVAVSLGDLGQVVGRIKAVPLYSMGLVLGCAVVYLLLKALQLHLLLQALDAHPGWRRFLLAFSVGELALTFPLGVFAQNWVLAGKKQVQFGRSSSATVVMLVMEIVMALLCLAIIGIPAWPPVRTSAAAILAAMVAVAFALFRYRLLDRLADRIAHARMHRLLAEAAGLLHGLEKLGQWRVLGVNLLVTPAYLMALAAGFWIMGHGVGLHALTLGGAAAIYAFALTSVLVSGGLFGQIGTVEVVGMEAAAAWGLDYTWGLALMLGFRLAWTGAMWLINGSVAAALWRSVRLGDSIGKRGEETGH